MSDEHPHINYVKIYWILLALFAVSMIGPRIGIFWLTMITAFGIAVVKAYYVCAYFMHLKFEKKLIWYIFGTSFLFMGLFIFGTAGDILNKEGRNWVNHAAFVADEPVEH